MDERAWFEWRLGDEVLGVEERVRGGGVEVRRRWQEVVVDGVVLQLSRGSRSAEGRRALWDGRRWHHEGGIELDGEVPTPGTWLRLAPFEPGPAVVHTVAVGDTWEVVGSGLPASLRFDAQGLVEGRMGAVSWRRLESEPAPVPPLELDLRVPVGRVERPRARRVARFRVDGDELTVWGVLDAEVPRSPFTPPSTEDPMGRWVGEVTAGSRSAWDAVVALSRSVAAHLEDAPTPGRTEGAELLDAGRGDCSEHVALFEAGAERLGIPTRPVAGLLLVEDHLVPHVWVEARLGSRWVAVDPTLGTAPADAARVPLSHRVDRAMDRVASGLSVEVLELR